MAMKRCAKCGKKIQWSALSCRFCGSDQPPQTGSEPVAPIMKAVLWIAGTVAVILGLILFGPRDERAVALQKCDEMIFIAGEKFYKLSPEERSNCRMAVINTSKQNAE